VLQPQHADVHQLVQVKVHLGGAFFCMSAICLTVMGLLVPLARSSPFAVAVHQYLDVLTSVICRTKSIFAPPVAVRSIMFKNVPIYISRKFFCLTCS
jgi:hypothetical protein